MEISDIKFNIEKILDDNKAQNITSIDLKKKIIYCRLYGYCFRNFVKTSTIPI